MNIHRNCTDECQHSRACDIDFGKRLADSVNGVDVGSMDVAERFELNLDKLAQVERMNVGGLGDSGICPTCGNAYDEPRINHAPPHSYGVCILRS